MYIQSTKGRRVSVTPNFKSQNCGLCLSEDLYGRTYPTVLTGFVTPLEFDNIISAANRAYFIYYTRIAWLLWILFVVFFSRKCCVLDCDNLLLHHLFKAF